MSTAAAADTAAVVKIQRVDDALVPDDVGDALVVDGVDDASVVDGVDDAFAAIGRRLGSTPSGVR